MNFREVLDRSARRSRSRVVLAMDVSGPFDVRIERATRLVAELGGGVAAVKINMHLLLPFGLLGLRGFLSECRARGIPVIADIKLNDIESTNLEAAGMLFTNGIDAVIANPFVGLREGLSGVLLMARKMEKGVILLVYMSHAGAREGYGIRLAAGRPMYRALAERTRRWNADGAIVSAKSVTILREVRRVLRSEQIILSPGVGAQGGDARRALAAGSDYVIVGRSIIDAENPVHALEQVKRESGF